MYKYIPFFETFEHIYVTACGCVRLFWLPDRGTEPQTTMYCSNKHHLFAWLLKNKTKTHTQPLF